MTKAVSEFIEMLFMENATVRRAYANCGYEATIITAGNRKITITFDGTPTRDDTLSMLASKEGSPVTLYLADATPERLIEAVVHFM